MCAVCPAGAWVCLGRYRHRPPVRCRQPATRSPGLSSTHNRDSHTTGQMRCPGLGVCKLGMLSQLGNPCTDRVSTNPLTCAACSVDVDSNLCCPVTAGPAAAVWQQERRRGQMGQVCTQGEPASQAWQPARQPVSCTPQSKSVCSTHPGCPGSIQQILALGCAATCPSYFVECYRVNSNQWIVPARQVSASAWGVSDCAGLRSGKA
jgi:hypothetical protein